MPGNISAITEDVMTKELVARFDGFKSRKNYVTHSYCNFNDVTVV